MEFRTEPEQGCERCGEMQRHLHIDPDDGSEVEVCDRCHFPTGSELTALDKIIGTLWSRSDQPGWPGPDEIMAFAESQHAGHASGPPLQDESIDPSALYERSVEITEAIERIRHEPPSHPEQELAQNDQLYDPGPDIYLP